jgi:hypothetical protein
MCPDVYHCDVCLLNGSRIARVTILLLLLRILLLDNECFAINPLLLLAVLGMQLLYPEPEWEFVSH